MSKDKNSQIARAINAHEAFKKSWSEGNSALGREMISPRGVRHTYTSYCFEVHKHMHKTVLKIRKILEVGHE